MKQIFLVIAISLVSLPALAGKIKSCDELKDEIAAKLANNGVKKFELKIVPRGSSKAEGKVMGSCENTTKYIIQVKK